LAAIPNQGQGCCHRLAPLVGEEPRELPSILTNGQEAAKTFQRKMFHVLTVFFGMVERFLLDPAEVEQTLHFPVLVST
jgi:hypothetical protein